MSEAARLKELVAVLTNQVALAQYRLAILETGSEDEGRRQMRICLITALSMLEGVPPDALLEDELEMVERTMNTLIASLTVRSIN